MLISCLVLFTAVSANAQLAGNEGYAWEARQSLNIAHKRDGGLSFAPSSTSFTIGGKDYLSPTGSRFRQHVLNSTWGLDGYVGTVLPVTVFEVEGEVTCSVLGDKVKEYSAVDDVWDQGFMSAAILTTKSSFHVAADVAGCLSGWGGDLLIKSGNATSDLSGVHLAHVDGDLIPPGPYLAKVDRIVTLTEVFRSYRDEAQAFTTGAVQATDGTFVDVANPVLGLNTLSIPVPSRLYTKYLSNPRALEGLRVGVKDLFDMAGLRTGGGNRAYFDTYPPKQTTAVAIQRLVDQGAIIVGRVKTSQFANGESATADWVDQMCPFNPRGDGYQQPSSSSSGPGAAAAAYDWLDHTIGSDTGGSIIDPATVGGTYGLRPTWNAISLQGALPLQASQDTAGFFARDAVQGAAFARGWYGDRFNNYTSFPKTLILPNSSWTFSSGYAGADQFNAFKSGLLDLIHPSSIDDRDFEQFWNSTGYYDKVGGQAAAEYLNAAYANLIGYYQWNNLGKPWFEDYASQNDGRQPFVDPAPLVRWSYARDNLTAADFNASLETKRMWKEFVDQEVLMADDQACSNALYVYPYGLGQTDYRASRWLSPAAPDLTSQNVYQSAPEIPLGFFYPSQFSGVPQLVIPIGQVAYQSTITHHTEYLPLAVTMFAANGCDYVLWDIAAALEKAGVTQAVAAGALAFPDRA